MKPLLITLIVILFRAMVAMEILLLKASYRVLLMIVVILVVTPL